MKKKSYHSLVNAILLIGAVYFTQKVSATENNEVCPYNYNSKSEFSFFEEYNNFLYSKLNYGSIYLPALVDDEAKKDSAITPPPPLSNEKSPLEKAADDLVEAIRPLPDAKKYELVKTFIDLNIKYAKDEDLYGSIDYWATLKETLKNGAGDCEDFALAIHELLKRSGADMNRIVIEYRYFKVNNNQNEPHMVITRDMEDGTRLIGDSLEKGLHKDSNRKDLSTPLYGFNETVLRVNNVVAIGVNPIAKLSKWRDVIERS